MHTNLYPFILYLGIPCISAAIGWFTNRIAIKMLFRPKTPPAWLPFRVQGLIPKRQPDIAKTIAAIVEKELINSQTIREHLTNVDIDTHLKQYAKQLVHGSLANRLTNIPLIGAMINREILDKLQGIVEEEMKTQGALLMDTLGHEVEQNLDIKSIVEARISQFDLDKLEAVTYEIAEREFGMIEKLGALLGFVIGCVQVGLIWAMGSIS